MGTDAVAVIGFLALFALMLSTMMLPFPVTMVSLFSSTTQSASDSTTPRCAEAV
jgi:ABC-type glycerol-3-phosphate transport system permease component